MSAEKCLVAELESLIKNAPELVKSVCAFLLRSLYSGAGNIYEIYGDNTLVESDRKSVV